MNIVVLLSVCFLLLALFTVVKVHPQGKHISISKHAAKKWWTYLLFGIALTFFGGIFLLFVQTFSATYFAMPMLYSIILPASWICLLITAWMPDRGVGKLAKIHGLAAYGIAFIMTIMMASLAFASNIPIYFRITGTILAIWYTYTLYLAFFVKASHRYYLVYQSFNVISFFTTFFFLILFQSNFKR